MAIMKHPTRRPAPLLLVAATVLLQLAAAWILDIAARPTHADTLLIAIAAIALVLLIHAVRFLIWGYTHRHYPLSHTYPLTALFFPCILLLSWWHGDAIDGMQLAGTGLITLGVYLISSRQAAVNTTHG